jgi:hypothetical protein
LILPIAWLTFGGLWTMPQRQNGTGFTDALLSFCDPIRFRRHLEHSDNFAFFTALKRFGAPFIMYLRAAFIPMATSKCGLLCEANIYEYLLVGNLI